MSIQHICSLCLDEVQGNVKDIVETRYESTLYSQRYSVVKLKDLSPLHLVYMPENLVQDLPISGQPPPLPQFEAVLDWKTVSTRNMGLVKFSNLPQTYWEHEFVIKALSAAQDTTILIEKAQELILAFGYTPDSIADLLHE